MKHFGQTSTRSLIMVASLIFAVLGHCDDEVRELQDALNRMTAPQLHEDEALTGIFIRTNFSDSQASLSSGENQEVIRTTVSELVANNKYVSEHVGEVRKANDSLDRDVDVFKRYGFHYTYDGEQEYIYDSRTRRGRVQQKSHGNDKLNSIMSPFAAATPRRFFSSVQAVGHEKYLNIKAVLLVEEGSHKAYEGEFGHSDPERYFRIVIDENNEVIKIVESDQNKRPLLEIERGNFVFLGSASILGPVAGHTKITKFTYDHHKGESCNVSTLDILDPKIVDVSKDDFKMEFPSNAAAIFDVSMRAHVAGVLASTRSVSDTLPPNVVKADLSDTSGGDILGRAQIGYSRLREAETGISDTSLALRLPAPNRKTWLLRMSQAGILFALLALLTWIVGRSIYRDKARSTNIDPDDRKGVIGDT